MTIENVLAREREVIEKALRELFPAAGEWPERLWEAMEYAVFAGGKRIRPALARLAYRAAGGDPDEITYAACGLDLTPPVGTPHRPDTPFNHASAPHQKGMALLCLDLPSHRDQTPCALLAGSAA